MSVFQMLFIVAWLAITTLVTIASGPLAPVTFCVMLYLGLSASGAIEEGARKK